MCTDFKFTTKINIVISFNFDTYHYTLFLFFLFFGRKYHIEFGVLDKEKGVAYGIYVDNINSTGYE